MSQFNAPVYDIERPTGQCAFTGRQLEPGDTYMAALVELPPGQPEHSDPDPTRRSTGPGALGFKRIDVSMQAWEQGHRPEHLFSYWRSTVPQPTDKKKLFVDDDVLINLFRRLADDDQPQRVAFRFVLGLILMRKKLLKYEGGEQRETEGGDKQEWWMLTPRGDDQPLAMLNPQLDEQQIRHVTEQLGEILEAEL